MEIPCSPSAKLTISRSGLTPFPPLSFPIAIYAQDSAVSFALSISPQNKYACACFPVRNSSSICAFTVDVLISDMLLSLCCVPVASGKTPSCRPVWKDKTDNRNRLVPARPVSPADRDSQWGLRAILYSGMYCTASPCADHPDSVPACQQRNRPWHRPARAYQSRYASIVSPTPSSYHLACAPLFL